MSVCCFLIVVDYICFIVDVVIKYFFGSFGIK